MKLHKHNHTMVIYTQHKFHEIPSIGYLVMVEEGKTDGRKQWTEGRTDNTKHIFLCLWQEIKIFS